MHARALSLILRLLLQGWTPIRCTDARGYPCPRGSFGVMAVSTFVSGLAVSYRAARPCAADCEAECVRDAECVGFTSTLLLLGRGGLSAAAASARCGSATVPCPTTQMNFRLPDSCVGAFDDTIAVGAFGTVLSTTLVNCSIIATARAERPDAYFSVPRIAAAARGSSSGGLTILLGLLLPSAFVGGIISFILWRAHARAHAR
jgi:hypothetical protein